MDFLVPPDERRARHRPEVLAAAAADPQTRARVDSGRLAEPFWYVDSPLTTPERGRGRSAGGRLAGRCPPPAPGVLLPDAPIRGPAGERNRMRALARDGFLLLTTAGVDDVAVRDAVAAAGRPRPRAGASPRSTSTAR